MYVIHIFSPVNNSRVKEKGTPVAIVDGIPQMKKPLNFPNQVESNDYKDWYNPDKKPNPGAYA